MSPPIVSEPTLNALGWTLVHFLWQGIVVFLTLESVVHLARLRTPQARYVASCIALVVMLLVPLFTFRNELRSARTRPILADRAAPAHHSAARGDAAQDDDAARDYDTAGDDPVAHVGSERVGRAHAGSAHAVDPERDGVAAHDVAHASGSLARASKSSTRRVRSTTSATRERPHVRSSARPQSDRIDHPRAWRAPEEPTAVSTTTQVEPRTTLPWTARVQIDAFLQRIEALLPWLVAAWFGGVVCLMTRLVASWKQARCLGVDGLRPAPRALHVAIEVLRVRLGVRQAVRVFESALAEVPTVVGWLKPVVLVPTSALAGLTPQQLEALLAHELAHVRRHDYVVNLVQTVVETLLFYHPAVWWVSQRIRDEREHCCDDLAVRACRDRFGYVRALTAMEELRALPSSVGMAMAADGGSLLARAQRLVGHRPASTSSPARGAAGLLAVTLVFALGLGMQRVGAAGAEPQPEPVDAPPESTPTPQAGGEPFADVPRSSTNRASTNRDVLGQRSARKGEAQPASQLRDPARLTPSAPRRTSAAPAARAGRLPSVEQLIAARQAGIDADDVAAMHELGIDDLDDLVRLRQCGVDAKYVHAMHELGVDDPDDLVHLRQCGVDAKYARAMHELGVDDPDDLVHLRQCGVDAKYMRAMRELGVDDPDDLVHLRQCGVDAKYTRAMRKLGVDDPDDLVRLRQCGVEAKYVRAMHDAGLDHLDPDTLIGLRQMGVEPRTMRQMQAALDEELDAEDYVTLWQNGVGVDFVRAMRRTWPELDLEELVELNMHGVHHTFAAAMRVLFPDLDPDEALELHRMGVDAAYVEAMRPFSSEWDSGDYVALLQNGVSPAWMHAQRDAGMHDLDVDEWIELHRRGDTMDWDDADGACDDPTGEAALDTGGIQGLSAQELDELREYGLDVRYVAAMLDAGLDPSPDALIHLYDKDIEPRHIRAIRDGDATALSVGDLVKLKRAGIDGDILDALREARR